MSATGRFSAVALLALCVTAGMGQRPGATRIPYDGSDTPDGPKSIHVDQDCRILPGSPLLPASKKSHPYRDSAICDIESPAESTHWEEKIVGNELQRAFVHVKERTFVLQDIADQPTEFIVQYAVPKDWFVDSDPLPFQVSGQTVYFRVYVKPGETVRLHVGVRREWPQKPKPI
jgi:hypothetical protein